MDVLRLSLLSVVTACGPVGIADGSGSAETDADADTNSNTDAETGSEECSTCAGAVEVADGFVQCSDGALDRVVAGNFDPSIDESLACQGTEAELSCTSDAECTDRPYGKCVHGSYLDELYESVTTCGCAYPCTSDADCQEGQACIPPGLVSGTSAYNTCRSADCRSNADCGPCGECGLGAYDDGCGWTVKLQCRSASDSCRADAECEPDGACYPEGVAWVCRGHNCDIGRPLLVDDVARTAPARRRSDWSVAFELPEDAELASYWASVAALEHASVASFARFGLQLTALGAPPELLRATLEAARDEVEHAKLAYGLASAYGGAPVGPGRLDLRGVALDTSWREVVRGLIEEACVGETLGVAEALAAAEGATHPVVRAVLERIAADELRHAQLAWRTLAWLLRSAERDDRSWALARLERTIAGLGRVAGGSHRPADGVLGGSARGELHRRAVVEVLEPVVRALGS